MRHDCGFPDEACSTCEEREAVDPGDTAREAVARVDITIHDRHRCCYRSGCTPKCW